MKTTPNQRRLLDDWKLYYRVTKTGLVEVFNNFGIVYTTADINRARQFIHDREKGSMR